MKYTCDVCRKIFDTVEECEKCEKAHGEELKKRQERDAKIKAYYDERNAEEKKVREAFAEAKKMQDAFNEKWDVIKLWNAGGKYYLNDEEVDEDIYLRWLTNFLARW